MFAMPEDSLLSYDHAFELLSESSAEVEPAELHGVLCGMLSKPGGFELGRWLVTAFSDLHRLDELAPECLEFLKSLVNVTHEGFRSDALAFEPFLPDDVWSFEERTDALSQWCEGYLFGLGTLGDDFYRQLDADSHDFLADITEIARLERRAQAASESPADEPTESDIGANEDEADDETNESDYFELVEYVRVGAVLIYESVDRSAGQKNVRDENG